jgi:CBS domain containing-hemolysin-like protein
MIFILVLLILFSAYFSATETAMSALNRVRIKNKAEDGNKRAKLVLSLVDEYDRLLSCILIANNIVNLSAASLATVLFTRYYDTYGPTISTIVLTIAILIFGEITPKSLAKEQPERFAMASAPFLQIFLFLLTPLNAFFSLFYKLAAKLLRSSGEEGITEEELITMVEEAEIEGGLDPHESQLIRAAIEFNDLEVEEILIPRVDIVAVDQLANVEKLAVAFAESGYSRIPVYDGNIDNIIGIIHEKDFYAARHRNISNFRELVTPVLYTTGNTKISSLLRLLQRNKTHMAIVVDEYGGTQGLVTLEDILEELVGEIWDEHDEVLEEFQQQDDGSYLISCSADLDDLFDRFSLRGDLSDSTSISGWVLEQLGRVPAEGDHFTYENLDVTVTRVDNRRVLEIRVALLPLQQEA